MTPLSAPRLWLLLLLGPLLLAGQRPLSGAGQATVNRPPHDPLIIEPYADDQVVNPADVHMETAPFADPDASDTHFCTDFAIWSVDPSVVAWAANCVEGIARNHIHLGDGAFLNAHVGRTELFFETKYELRVRFRDSSRDEATAWSVWARRPFQTGRAATLFPLAIGAVEPQPEPIWLRMDNRAVSQAVTTPLTLTLATASGRLLLTAVAENSGVRFTHPAEPVPHEAVRVTIAAGSGSTALPPSTLFFSDEAGEQHTLYLPEIALAPGAAASFWIAANGSTYAATATEDEPVFETPAQPAAVPWRVAQPGYEVDIVATGFRLPVNIAFALNPTSDPEAPAFYVTELYGDVKVVTGAGVVTDFATNLLNFDPTGNFPGSGELGLTGVAIEPDSGDLFVGLLYAERPLARVPVFHPKIARLRRDETGLRATTVETVLDMADAVQGESHQIGALSFGPDGKLYVHMGDGHDPAGASDLHNYVGKILRLNADGSPAQDNPFFDEKDGIDAADYVYAAGFRNPFGGAWRAADATLYTVENGPKLDRFAPVNAGRTYGWDGSDRSMYHRALFNWFPSVAPVNLAFIQPETFAGSGFPPSKMGHAFVTESGATWASGVQERGKRISEFILSSSGELLLGPVPFLAYNGAGKASVAALAAGPDGLYFSDLYKDVAYDSPVDRGANVLRVSFVGAVDFGVDKRAGAAPLSVAFHDASTRDDIVAYTWAFGDGTTSVERAPSHTYERPGTYDVRLTVETANGQRFVQKNNLILVDVGAGLHADYFFDTELRDLRLSRIDPTIDFDWRFQSPEPLALLVDKFSVRWSGQITPAFDEEYTFYATSDDGVRLWIDGRLIIDDWVNHPVTENAGRVRLRAGQRHDIILTTYDSAGLALSRLEWSSASQPRQVVPQAALYPYPLPDPTAVEVPPPAPTPGPLADNSSGVNSAESPDPRRQWIMAGGVAWLLAVALFARKHWAGGPMAIEDD